MVKIIGLDIYAAREKLSKGAIFFDSMTITIAPDPDQLLNLSPAQTVIENLLQRGDRIYEQQLRFAIIPRNQAIHGNCQKSQRCGCGFIVWIPAILAILLDWKAGNLPLHRHACATPI